MKTVLIIGLGSIGKGVLIPLFSRKKWNLIISNRNPNKLEYCKKGYNVIDNISTLHYQVNTTYPLNTLFNLDINQIDFICISVPEIGFQNVTKHLDPLLKQNKEKQVHIFLFSNTLNATSKFMHYLNHYTNIKCYQALCFVGARETENHDVILNTKNSKILLEENTIMTPSNFDFVQYVSDINQELIIKLSTINRFQLHIALLGAINGYKTMQEVIENTKLFFECINSLKESCAVLEIVYPDRKEELRKLYTTCLSKVMNGKQEPVSRFLKNLSAKLEPDERVNMIIGMAQSNHYSYEYLENVKFLAIQYLNKTTK